MLAVLTAVATMLLLRSETDVDGATVPAAGNVWVSVMAQVPGLESAEIWLASALVPSL